MARQPFIDRAIAVFSPQRALSRAAARAKLSALGEVTAFYDGASRGHRTANRFITSSSADSEIRRALPRLRDVSRDMERNNVYAARAFNVIPTDVVGAGIVPNFTTPSVRLKKRIKDLVAAHLESTAIDYDGRLNLYGLQFLAVRTMARDGEVLLVRYRATSQKRLPLPLQVRVLEADYLDTSRDGVEGGRTISGGIEFDESGARVAYYLFNEHPGSDASSHRPVSKRVSASDVIHLFRVERPGQSRGVPWIAPAVMTLWDLKDYEEAELVRQRVAACFAAFEIETGGNSGPLAEQATKTKAGSVVDFVEPGSMVRLPPGKDIKFSAPPQVQGYAEYVRMGQRRIATGIGVPFNVLASDDSQENFASSRRGHIVYQRTIDVWRWQTVIPVMCVGLGEWFLAAAQIKLSSGESGVIQQEWTPPKRDLISPKEEVPMMRDMVRAGLLPRSEMIRSLGYDPDWVDDEIAADNARADRRKLSFDSDGRRPLNGPVAEPQDKANGQ